TKGQIKDSFEVLEEKNEDLLDEPGNVEIIIFKGPLGKMKLERISRPVVLGERAIGSRRIGSSKTIQKEYSSEEMVHALKAYKYDEDSSLWVEIEPGDSFKSE
ncbi:MAG: hypothetical protein PHH01_05110, partial [Patescibacteria group bacterium]|nr:hypothetical protein [Patescibacteria group bacterium]